jgi:histidyl-tRNA synthetase
MAFTVKSLKSQMRQASRVNSRYCLLIGENELAEGSVVIKNMDDGSQESLRKDDLGAWAAKIAQQ